MARTTGLALVVAACLALAGCGGDDDTKTTRTADTVARTTDADRVLAAAKAYTTALVDGDYEAACARLTPTARANFSDAADATGANGCPGLLRGLFGDVPKDERSGATGVQAKVVFLSNDRARVRTTVASQTDTFALSRVGGQWLVDASL